jgi:hypothetical protein
MHPLPFDRQDRSRCVGKRDGRPRHRATPERKAPGGFTLVEMLVVGLVTVSVLGGMVLALADSGKRMWTMTDTRVATLTAAQIALDRLTEDLRVAHQANLGCGSDQLAFNPVGGGLRTTYSRDPVTRLLTRAQGGGNPQIIAADIEAFSPTCQAGLVKLQLTARVNSPQGPSTQTLNSQVWIQNP